MSKWKESWAYQQISFAYQNLFARRSKLPYIKHIDEGITILEKIGASPVAVEAFILHPLFQSDRELFKIWFNHTNPIKEINPRVVVLCMEYRAVANAFLSKDVGIKQPELSVIPAVNHMLIADKVQNQADFIRFQSCTGDNATMTPQDYSRLEKYFRLWREELTVFYPELMSQFPLEEMIRVDQLTH